MFYENKRVTSLFHQQLASIYGIGREATDDIIKSISLRYRLWIQENEGPFEEGDSHPYDRFVFTTRTKNNSAQGEILETLKNPSPSKTTKKQSASASKKMVNYDYITDYCRKKYAVIVSSSDNKQEIFIFDREAGRYRLNSGDIERTITEGLTYNGITAVRKIQPEINEIISRIKKGKSIPREEGLPFNLMKNAIPCRNGVYDIEDKKLHLASPAYGFSYTLDVDYLEDVDTSFVESYLRGLVAPEDYPLLLQIVVSILLGESYKRFYVFYNISGNNGKTTFQNFITYMVGESNVANLSLEAIVNHRFMLAELYGKVANIAGDIPPKPIYDPSILKQLVGDDKITAEKKGKDPFTFTNKSIIIFSANTPPPINDSTDAFWSRVVIVKFPNQFPVNLDFRSDLFTENNKSALLKLSIDHMPTLIENGPVPIDIAKTEQEYRKVSDSVYAFVSECLEPYDEFVFNEPEVYNRLSLRVDDNKPLPRILEIEFDFIHRSYKNFCKQKGMKDMGRAKFERALENNSLISISVKRRGPIGNQIAIVIGARLNAIGMGMECQHITDKNNVQSTLVSETV